MANLLSLTKVSFAPHKQAAIIRAASLAVNAGDFIVIVGGNGSGKSTLLKLIDRRYRHTSGKIKLNDRAIGSYSKKVWSQQVVTLTQFVRDSLFAKLTIEENAKLLAMSYHCQPPRSGKRFLEVLRDYLAEFNVKLSRSLKTPLYLLSGGEQQILAFALYLRHQPKLLLLDEHTSALDPKTATKLMAITDRIIRQRKVSCLMTTHNLDFATQYGSRLIAIREGAIIYEADADTKSKLEKRDLLDCCY